MSATLKTLELFGKLVLLVGAAFGLSAEQTMAVADRFAPWDDDED